jgi:hypothetical protein
MLLERAAGLAAKISQYQNFKKSASEAEKFETRARQFDALSEKVVLARGQLARFRDAGVPVDFTPTDSQGYAAKAKVLRDAIKDNLAAINDPPFDIKNEFNDRIAAIATAAQKAMEESWRVYVGKRADFGSSDVLAALEAIPQFKQSVAKIKRLRVEVAGLGNVVPPDPKTTVARLNNLVAEHDAAWSELAAGDIPTSVIAFIRAAASEGAVLSALTDEVRSWLKNHNLLTVFRIRLR